MLLLTAKSGQKFDADHQQQLQQLREPFSMALKNDRRIHEIAALRQAAEADRSSLLRRLGQKQLVEEIVGEETGLRLLRSYQWPGNIREFGAVIDRAAILGNGQCLEVAKSLGFTETRQPPVSSPNADSASHQPWNSTCVADFQTLDQVLKTHIEQALTKTHGQIEGQHGAAALLGINPHTLRARMRRMQIEWSRFRN